MSRVLQFSGGKDSLACLYLLKAEWDDLTVFWMNAGAAWPETLELMEQVRSLVPHFVEGTADVLADIATHGPPSDLLPMRSTAIGRAIRGEAPKVRTWLGCCTSNVWVPMGQWMKKLGATEVIRGQRTLERYTAPIRDGHVEDGITYRFPIEGWSEAEVFGYLKSVGAPIPAYYDALDSSLDCWCCTAYLDEKLSHIRRLQHTNPQRHLHVQSQLEHIRAAIGPAYALLMEA